MSTSATFVGWDSSPVRTMQDGTGVPFSKTFYWHFWLTAGVLGFLFFMTNHDVFVSRLPDYAHYDDTVIEVAVGTNMFRRISFFLLAVLGIGLAVFSIRGPWKFHPWIALPMLGYIAWCCSIVLWSV